MADVGSTVTNPASCHKSEYRLVDCSQIRDKFEETGQVRKKDYPAEKAYRKLNEPAQFFILYLVLERPGIYLREIRSELLSQLGLEITVSAICKFLHK